MFNFITLFSPGHKMDHGKVAIERGQADTSSDARTSVAERIQKAAIRKHLFISDSLGEMGLLDLGAH